MTSQMALDVGAAAAAAPTATESPAPPPAPAEPAALERAPRPRRAPLPLRYLKVRCQRRCGWIDKVRIGDGLDQFAPLMACPGCMRVACIEVYGWVTR